MTSAPFQKNSIKNQSSLIPLTLFILLVLSGLIYWWHVNPLPSDEKMIAHFYAHRAEIEKLVKHYREFKPQETLWGDLPEIKALKQKAGVKHIGSGGEIWRPDPYSAETAKPFEMRIKDSGNPFWFVRPYNNISIDLLDERQPNQHFGWVLISSGPQLIFKSLYYFPEIPKVERGKWWAPVESDGQLKHGYRVLPTLDDYPPNWKKGECVYRQIEAQWFILMCIAAV